MRGNAFLNSAMAICFLFAKCLGQILVDFLLGPFVLAPVAPRERALHLAEDGARDERNVIGPVAEFAHHVLVVGDGVPAAHSAGPDRLATDRKRAVPAASSSW